MICRFGRSLVWLVLSGLWLAPGGGARAQSPAVDEGEAVEHQTERGPVTVKASVRPAVVSIGDPVNLRLEVTAEPGVELLMPEFGSALERFAILEFVPRERIDEAGRTKASQAYRLQAPSSGQHAIPPITVEFVDRRPGQRAAPDDEDAFEVLTERLVFEVKSVVPAGAGDDLRPVAGRLEPLALSVDPGLPWLTMFVLVLAAMGGLTWWWYRVRRVDTPQSAYQLAMERLVVLEDAPLPSGRESMDRFFVELSSLVRRYLEGRFLLHAPELTTEEFLDVVATSPDLARDHRGFLQSFLRDADQVKFAGHVPERQDVQRVLGAVRRFLEQTGREHADAVPESPAVETGRA